MSGWSDQDVRDLRAANARVRREEARQARIVAELRQRECPWSVIGDALGVSKQAAQQRFRSRRVSTVDRPLDG